VGAIKTGKPVQEMVKLLLGLVIVAAITIAIISTLREPAPGSVTVAASPSLTSSPQQPATPPQEPTTAVPYPVPPEYPLTPSAVAAAETATAADIFYTQQAISRATHQASSPTSALPATFPPTGTNESPETILVGKQLGFDVLNAWGGILNGKPISVYAGASSTDPNQGEIFILIYDGIAKPFLTPTKHGAVRVVSEHNNRLTLVSTDGTTYYFDIPAMSYVPSLTVFAPSITPPPTRTPVPPNYETSTPYPAP
jgi:hypothetical protein